MIKRVGKNLSVLTAEVPSGSVQLERDGYTVLRDVLTRDEVDAMRRRDRRRVRSHRRANAAATTRTSSATRCSTAGPRHRRQSGTLASSRSSSRCSATTAT